MAKGTADSKLKKIEISDYSLSIGGFQQPEVFLSEHGDMRKRNDDFIGRLIVTCPYPAKHRWSEIRDAEMALKENYSDEQRNFVGILMDHLY